MVSKPTLVVGQAPLAAALGTVGRAVNAKAIIAVHGHILLEASDGLLAMTGYDTNIGIVCRVPADVDGFPSVAVPARVFTETVAALPDGDVRLEVERKGRLAVVAGAFRASLAVLDGASFPPIPRPADALRVAVGAAALKEAMGQALIAAPSADPRPQVNCLRFRVSGDELSLSGCDGRLLARRFVPAEREVTGDAVVEASVPYQTCREIHAAIGRADKPEIVGLAIGAGRIEASIGQTTISSQLVALPYPNLDAMIPTAAMVQSAAVVRIAPLRAALDAVLPTARHALPIGAATCRLDGDALAFEAEAADVGRASSRVPITDRTGPAAEWSMSLTLLKEISGAVGAAAAVRIGLTGPGRPILVTPEPEADGITMVMPFVLGQQTSQGEKAAPASAGPQEAGSPAATNAAPPQTLPPPPVPVPAGDDW